MYSVIFVKDGRVAQLVEQCPFKAWVEGSSPSALTRFIKANSLAGRNSYRTDDVENSSTTTIVKTNAG
jgi:hypothetical protein